jgi:hypothetical protein
MPTAVCRPLQYATFCELAGQNATDPTATAAGLPPLDSLSMVAYLRGDRATSPRSELQVDSNVLLQAGGTDGGDDAAHTIFKLFGSNFPSTPQGSTGWACFPGPHYPNGTDPSCHSGGDCDRELGGCLFELVSDDGEHVDRAASEPAVMKAMVTRLGVLQSTLFAPDRGSKDPRACEVAQQKWGGFYGPFIFLEDGEQDERP